MWQLDLPHVRLMCHMGGILIALIIAFSARFDVTMPHSICTLIRESAPPVVAWWGLCTNAKACVHYAIGTPKHSSTTAYIAPAQRHNTRTHQQAHPPLAQAPQEGETFL